MGSIVAMADGVSAGGIERRCLLNDGRHQGRLHSRACQCGSKSRANRVFHQGAEAIEVGVTQAGQRRMQRTAKRSTIGGKYGSCGISERCVSRPGPERLPSADTVKLRPNHTQP